MANPELAVINAVCKNKDIGTLLSGSNVDEMFTAYGDVWSDVKKYYNQYGTIPDIKVFQEKFQDLDYVEVSGATGHYVNELREQHVGGQIRDIMLKVAGSLDKNGVGKTYDKMMTELSRLAKFTSNARDIDLTDYKAAETYLNDIRERALAQGGTPGISTGFSSMDSAMPTGIGPGHFIVIMGYTGKGKTFFSTKLAISAWEQGYKPMIISLEMTPEEVRERAYPMMSPGLFTINDMARGDIQVDDLHEFGRKKLENSNKFVVVSNQGVSDLTPNIIQGKIDTHKPDVVYVDYMQLMSDNDGTTQMTPRMMNLSRQLKLLAQSNNIPIVAITAVTDDEGGKREGPPTMGQVAWSKAIEYDANLILAVHKHDDTDVMEVVSRKNRHGNLFDFYLEVDINRGIWTEKFD